MNQSKSERERIRLPKLRRIRRLPQPMYQNKKGGWKQKEWYRKKDEMK
jgi:hypothetical protein